MDGKWYHLKRLKTEGGKKKWVVRNQEFWLPHIKFHTTIRHSNGSIELSGSYQFWISMVNSGIEL